jgi:hypothetical protein
MLKTLRPSHEEAKLSSIPESLVVQKTFPNLK